MDKDDVLILTLSNGYTLHSGPGEVFEIGGHIQFCDPKGDEVVYWDKQEWVDQPEEIIANVLNILRDPQILVSFQSKVKEEG